jgi:hypothetical protein
MSAASAPAPAKKAESLNLFAVGSLAAGVLWILAAIVGRLAGIGATPVAVVMGACSILAIALARATGKLGPERGRILASFGVVLGWIGVFATACLVYWIFLPPFEDRTSE